MLLIQNDILDPYFNIASEEYFLKNFSENCFMLWRNKPSVIIGKHQNALAEINYNYIKENNIPVVRRLSGGGTVFHDLGNLNFTFITNGKEGALIDFKKYTKPILDVLSKLSVDAKFEGKNDLRINGKKVSGNAEHVFKNRVLHHGTLLFSSELSMLIDSLKVIPEKYKDNAVKSIRSKVSNIKDFLDREIDVLKFKDIIYNYIQKLYSNTVSYEFTENDKLEIHKLAEKKYKTWKWNFGYSPQYIVSNKIDTKNGRFEVFFAVKKGFIESIKIINDDIDGSIISNLENSLIGIKHEECEIRENLFLQLKNDWLGMSIETLVPLFF